MPGGKLPFKRKGPALIVPRLRTRPSRGLRVMESCDKQDTLTWDGHSLRKGSTGEVLFVSEKPRPGEIDAGHLMDAQAKFGIRDLTDLKNCLGRAALWVKSSNKFNREAGKENFLRALELFGKIRKTPEYSRILFVLKGVNISPRMTVKQMQSMYEKMEKRIIYEEK